MIIRYSGNSILTKKDIPYPVATVHNAEMIKHNDEYNYAPSIAQAKQKKHYWQSNE